MRPGHLLNFDLVASHGIPHRLDAIRRFLAQTHFLRHARSLGNDGLFACFRHLDGLVGEFGDRLPARNGPAIDHDLFVLQGDLLLDRCFHHVAPDTVVPPLTARLPTARLSSASRIVPSEAGWLFEAALPVPPSAVY